MDESSFDVPIPQLCTHAPAPIVSDYRRRYFGLFPGTEFRADENVTIAVAIGDDYRARDFGISVDMGYVLPVHESREEADKVLGRRFSAAAGSRRR